MTKAREKLQISRLHLSQRELMGEDIDLEDFFLKTKGAIGIDVVDSIVDATITRTIEGASTLDVTINDQGGDLLNSPLLHSHCDVEIDGLWFRLAKLGKQGVNLTTTFEDREVAVLRTYNKPIKQSQATSRNAQVTRAEFVLRLIREVKEFKIPYVIPELHKIQKVENEKQQVGQDFQNLVRSHGIGPDDKLLVKGREMDTAQKRNANIILDVATSHMAPHPVMVMAIMCCIQESSIRNLPQPKPGDGNFRSLDPDLNPVGCFQQIKAYNWPASRDVAKDAAEFIKRAMSQYGQHSSEPLYAIIERVQHSGHPRAYGTWHPEAEQIVAAYYGELKGGKDQNTLNWNALQAGQDNEYEFYRGKPVTGPDGQRRWRKESSWACLQRLAEEVNKRSFFVSGTYYFISDPLLFRSKPRMTIDEDHEAVNSIDFDYDIGKSFATVTVNAQIGRWIAPPGSVVKLREMGPLSGRWLVSDIERSLFEHTGEIRLIKPTPQLPEPAGSNIDQGSSTNQKWKLKPRDDPGHGKFLVGTGLVKPIPAAFSAGPASVIHDTIGLPGYPAIDDFAHPGSPVIAPEAGTITKLSGHDPLEGAVEGAGGPLGYSIYLKGKSSGTTYYMTHLDKRYVAVGQQVSEADVIATVANYDKFGRPSHVHIGVHPGKIDIHDLIAAPRAVKG